MFNKRIYSFILATMLLAPLQAHAMCATEEEMAALNARVLQSDLMVAALSCGQQKRYNSFVGRFKKELARSGNHLREYFTRNYPGASESQMNSFVTALANKSSHKAMDGEREEYCTKSEKLFDSTMAISRGQLEAVATHLDLSARHGVQPCGLMARLHLWLDE